VVFCLGRYRSGIVTWAHPCLGCCEKRAGWCAPGHRSSDSQSRVEPRSDWVAQPSTISHPGDGVDRRADRKVRGCRAPANLIWGRAYGEAFALLCALTLFGSSLGLVLLWV
jgi:hypothetical protein